MQLQEQMLRDREAHDELKRKHRALEESLRARREDFVQRENVFWLKEGGGGPYCPKCLQEQSPRPAELLERNGMRFCAVCNFSTTTPERDERTRATAEARSRRERERGRSWMGS